MLQVAEAQGCAPALRQALAAMVVGSIGPVCSAALRDHGLPVDIEPSHPKLGHLIKETASRSVELLARKRTAPAIVIASAPARPAATGLAQAAIFDGHPMMRACRMQPTPYTPSG